MFPAPAKRNVGPLGFAAPLVLIAAMAWGGCASRATTTPVDQPVATLLSPAVESMAARDAWRLAEQYVQRHAGSEVVVGSGDSMLPLYRDRTVLVLQPVAFAELRRSMTVVFIGDRGRPVAHVLTEKTPRGWLATGLGNRESDRTLVRQANLIGVVVRAYSPMARGASADAAPDSLVLHREPKTLLPDAKTLASLSSVGEASRLQ